MQKCCYKTNHSLRATTATRLYQAGVDEQLVIEMTGHRSLEGVRSYKRTSDQQRETLSDIFNNKIPKVDGTIATCSPPPQQQSIHTSAGAMLAYSASSLREQLPSAQLSTSTNIAKNYLPGTYTFNSCALVTLHIHN